MDGPETQVQSLLQQGIKTAQAKRKPEAFQILSEVVRRDPRSEQGWLWLAAVAPTAQESLAAFDQVLAINSNNEQARVGRRWAAARLPGAGSSSSQPIVLPETTPMAPPPPTPASPPPAAPAPNAGLSSENLFGMFAPTGTSPRVAPEMPVAAPPPVAPAEPAPPPWRASGDLAGTPGGLDWDDSGLGLGSRTPAAYPASEATPAPAAPETLYTRTTSPAPPAPSEAYRYAPSGADADMDLDAFDLDVPESARPVPTERGLADADSYTPPPAPIAQRSSPLPLVLGLLLLLVGVGLLVGGWLSLRQTGYFDAVDARFFQAQLSGDTATAGKLLVPDLASQYATAHDLPDIQLASTLNALAKPVTVQAMPEANPDGVGESVVTLTPKSGAPVRYLVHLTNSSGQWLIDQILPYPSSASAAPAP